MLRLQQKKNREDGKWGEKNRFDVSVLATKLYDFQFHVYYGSGYD